MKPEKLRYYLQSLSQSLGNKAQWGEKSSTHLYGIIGVIGTFATVMGLLLAFNTLVDEKSRWWLCLLPSNVDGTFCSEKT